LCLVVSFSFVFVYLYQSHERVRHEKEAQKDGDPHLGIGLEDVLDNGVQDDVHVATHDAKMALVGRTVMPGMLLRTDQQSHLLEGRNPGGTLVLGDVRPTVGHLHQHEKEGDAQRADAVETSGILVGPELGKGLADEGVHNDRKCHGTQMLFQTQLSNEIDVEMMFLEANGRILDHVGRRGKVGIVQHNMQQSRKDVDHKVRGNKDQKGAFVVKEARTNGVVNLIQTKGARHHGHKGGGDQTLALAEFSRSVAFERLEALFIRLERRLVNQRLLLGDGGLGFLVGFLVGG
jgi:hypothetical protein